METKEFGEGEEAYSDEKGLNDNPYESGTSAHRDWERGFKYAEKHDPFAPENF